MDGQGLVVSPLTALPLQHEISELRFGPVQSEDKRLKPGTVGKKFYNKSLTNLNSNQLVVNPQTSWLYAL